MTMKSLEMSQVKPLPTVRFHRWIFSSSCTILLENFVNLSFHYLGRITLWGSRSLLSWEFQPGLFYNKPLWKTSSSWSHTDPDTQHEGESSACLKLHSGTI